MDGQGPLWKGRLYGALVAMARGLRIYYKSNRGPSKELLSRGDSLRFEHLNA